MSCEQKDPDKEWNKRTINLVNQKNSFLEDPELFLKRVWREASRELGVNGIPFKPDFEDECLEATVKLTSVMRPEELTALECGLKKIWIERMSGLAGGDIERSMFESVINSLMACQEARRVSCVKMVPDL